MGCIFLLLRWFTWKVAVSLAKYHFPLQLTKCDRCVKNRSRERTGAENEQGAENGREAGKVRKYPHRPHSRMTAHAMRQKHVRYKFDMLFPDIVR